MKNLKTEAFKKLHFLLAGFLIPLGPSSQWHEFNFLSEMPNQVIFSPKELKISVNHSASPLIYVFKKAKQIKSLKVEFNLNGFPSNLPTNITQGFKGADDFILRVGLIFKGSSRMNWIQRQLAPAWLVKMEQLLPPGLGIEKVHFLTTCRDPRILNQAKDHFLNSTMKTECTTLVENNSLNNKNYEIYKKLNTQKEVLGLWLAPDGDDLKSQFQVNITKIEFN